MHSFAYCFSRLRRCSLQFNELHSGVLQGVVGQEREHEGRRLPRARLGDAYARDPNQLEVVASAQNQNVFHRSEVFTVIHTLQYTPLGLSSVIQNAGKAPKRPKSTSTKKTFRHTVLMPWIMRMAPLSRGLQRLAGPIMSRFSKAIGMACIWIGVGLS